MKKPKDIKILVVEDDQLCRLTVVEFLKILDFQVIDTDNGMQGFIKAKEEMPDLILLDVMMPRLDGLTFLTKMIDDDLDMPVIMTTALGQEKDVVAAIKRGAKDYMIKPIDLESLKEKIEKVLNVQF